MIFAGIMSGSSLDGVDIALVEFDDQNFKILKAQTFNFPPILKERLSKSAELPVRDYFQLEQDYSVFISACIESIKSNIEIKAIGFHGHTVVHHPELGYSIQMGNAAFLAAQSGFAVVSDFRNQDIAKGGVGTPLVPILERDLFPDYQVFINLGGICNISFFDSDRNAIAYDVCPCNQVLNRLAQKLGYEYDHAGKLAAQGTVNQTLLDQLNSLAYYTQSAPKSLDNGWVQNEFYSNIKRAELTDIDTLSTMVQHIVDQLVMALKLATSQLSLKLALITGGGAFNDYLVDQIKLRFKAESIEIVLPDKEIIDFKESVLMAYLAKLRLENKPNVLSTVTGASNHSVSGAIYLA